MRGLRNLAGLLVAWVLAVTGAGAAETVQNFHEAVAAAYGPYREAVHYLETGNAGLAALAIERAQDQWRKVEARFAAAPPEAFARDEKWRETLASIGKALGQGLSVAESGNAEAALAALVTVRRSLAELRLRSGQRVYSDCIDAMNAAMDRLYAYRRKPPARGNPAEMAAFKQAVADTEKWYRRCRDEAPPALRDQAEFRRLFDGAIASLGRLSRSTKNGPDDLLVS
ncbi:MAG: hypothetical protein ACREIP_13720, partial [Alphaproteobacteria bacterium]